MGEGDGMGWDGMKSRDGSSSKQQPDSRTGRWTEHQQDPTPRKDETRLGGDSSGKGFDGLVLGLVICNRSDQEEEMTSYVARLGGEDAVREAEAEAETEAEGGGEGGQWERD